MARRELPRGGASRSERMRAHPAVKAARKAWPVVLAAKQRWDALTPAQQERYRRMAADYARRGRETLGRRRPKR